jgi:hypothetical protein
MSEETDDQPVADDEVSLDAGVETEADAPEATEVEYDEDGNPIEGQADADEFDEVEYEGQKHKIPKALKPLILMQADYTKKTQAVADERKALAAREAEMTQNNQAFQEHIAEVADLRAAEAQLAQYQQIDWDTWEDQDPDAAGKAWRKYERLRSETQQKGQALHQKIEQRKQAAQSEQTKRRTEAETTLAKEIPGWSPELKSTLTTTALQLGVTTEELEAETDPRIWKLLHLASLGTKAQQQAKTTKQIVQQQATKPAATVTAAASPANKNPDRMSTDEWMKWRNAQLRKKAG